jgi:flagellar protein FliS
MSAYAAAAPQAYRDQSVLTAPPEQLVLMLYDGARRFLHQGAVTMREGDLERCNDRLQKAEAIIDELLNTLDMSAGQIAENLQSLYFYFKRELLQARLQRQPEKIEQVSSLLGEIRDGWAQMTPPPQTP